MRSLILSRRNLLLGLPAIGGLSAVKTSSADQTLSLPKPTADPVLGDWKEFTYQERLFDNLRELALSRLPLIESAFAGGHQIARAVEANKPVSDSVYDAWSGEWQGDFLGFDSAGNTEYGIRVRQVLGSCAKERVEDRSYLVQPLHIVYCIGSEPPVFEQAFNIIHDQHLYCVFYNKREGTTPFLGYEVTLGHFFWVRKGIFYSERLYKLPDGRRLYHIQGFQMPPERSFDRSQLKWMEGWYYGQS